MRLMSTGLPPAGPASSLTRHGAYGSKRTEIEHCPTRFVLVRTHVGVLFHNTALQSAHIDAIRHYLYEIEAMACTAIFTRRNSWTRPSPPGIRRSQIQLDFAVMVLARYAASGNCRRTSGKLLRRCQNCRPSALQLLYSLQSIVNIEAIKACGDAENGTNPRARVMPDCQW